jgi:Putative member of DMT superfamily (DUF486)
LEEEVEMSVAVRMTLLLVGSNVFMTFAWYAHLKTLNDRKWYIAALASWGIALFEYLLQVPANRIGYTQFSVAQLNPGGDHSLCIRAVCGALSARTHETGLFMGRTVPVRRGLFHVSVVVSFSEVR